MFNPSRILVPTDMSPSSGKAIRDAFDIAKRYDAEIVVLHVVDDPVKFCTVDFFLNNDLVERAKSELLDSAQQDVRCQLIHFQTMGDIPVHAQVRVGVPADEILHESELLDIDLIVMSATGNNSMEQNTVGGIAKKILSGAKCTVLLVK